MNEADIDRIAQVLRAARAGKSASNLAEMIDELSDEGLNQSSMIFVFRRAFPDIPLRKLIEASEWNRLCNSSMTTGDFDVLLANWLGEPDGV